MKMALKHRTRNIYLNYTEIPFLFYQDDKNSKIWKHMILMRLWRNSHSQTSLMGIQNGTAPVERNLAIFGKGTYVFTFWPSILKDTNKTMKRLYTEYSLEHCLWYQKVGKQTKCASIGDQTDYDTSSQDNTMPP